LGLFFVFGFSSDNYFMFVPFPGGKNISATLMILGFFWHLSKEKENS